MGRARRVVRAQQLWFAILEAQIETGNPYMLFKDSCNRKSNQQVCAPSRGGCHGCSRSHLSATATQAQLPLACMHTLCLRWCPATMSPASTVH